MELLGLFAVFTLGTVVYVGGPLSLYGLLALAVRRWLYPGSKREKGLEKACAAMTVLWLAALLLPPVLSGERPGRVEWAKFVMSMTLFQYAPKR